jgi:flavin reductase (DIM6/NTAB) family NADH-FMN oxidoreductase RutF
VSDFGDISGDLSRFLRRGEIEADREAFGATPSAPGTVDAEAFKAAMRVLAGGVVMVTARRGEQLYGLTISACCSISASPPRVLISLAETASCLSAVLETRRFGLSILRAGQRSLAELGAVPGGPKEVDAFSESRDGTVTMIAGALAHLDCAVDHTFPISDHVLVIGNVEHAVSVPPDELEEPGPLLYFNRTFHALGEAVE